MKHIPLWHTTSKKIIADNPFLTLEEHRREEEGTGHFGYFYIVNAPDWVNIIALTDAGEMVLVEQFRQGSERIELELPSGIINEAESPSDAALRELLEETGYERSDRSEFKKIGEFAPNPAFIRNTCYTYILTHARPTGREHFDENENINVRLVPKSEIENLIKSREIRHSLSISSLYLARLAGY